MVSKLAPKNTKHGVQIYFRNGKESRKQHCVAFDYKVYQVSVMKINGKGSGISTMNLKGYNKTISSLSVCLETQE